MRSQQYIGFFEARRKSNHRPSRVIFYCLAITAISLFLSACQIMPEASEPVVEPIIVRVAEAKPPAQEQTIILANDLRSVIELMQDGDAETAIASLQAMLANKPGNSVMQGLLKQLQTDPNDFFEPEFQEITVQKGDTLSTLAQNHLGDPLLFYALARYNGISVPKFLEVDRQFKIPNGFEDKAKAAAQARLEELAETDELTDNGVDNEVVAETEQAVEQVADQAVDQAVDQGFEYEKIAAYHVAGGNTESAWRILLQAADGDKLSKVGEQTLFDLTQSLTDKAVSDKQPLVADQILADSISRFEVGEFYTTLKNRRKRLQSVTFLEKSAQTYDRGELESAWRLAADAKAVDGSHDEAIAKEQTLRSELIDQLHETALRQWRGREVSKAIMQWESLLLIEPGFEPANVYLERARALDNKLNADSLNNLGET